MNAEIGTGLLLADVDGWDHMGGWGWGMAALGLIAMIALVALVVWIVTSAPRGGDSPHTRARDVLDQRYARGEIGRDEYLERKADLEA